MTFAAYLDGPYKVVLLLHLFCVTIGFGAVFTNKFYALQGQKRPGPGGLAIAEANYAVSKLAEKAIYLVPIFGLALVGMSDSAWEFSQTWVWLSLVLYVVGVGVSHSVMFPSAKKMNELLASATSGPPPQDQLDALGKKLAAGGMFLDLLLVVLFVLMIWKPGV
ncbi:MAG: hypothetical protein QOE63_306 [Acidimicrobiaceae bacterium]